MVCDFQSVLCFKVHCLCDCNNIMIDSRVRCKCQLALNFRICVLLTSMAMNNDKQSSLVFSKF